MRHALILLLFATAAAAAPPPPDIRLEWAGGAAPVEGPAGKVVDLGYAVRNVGGETAFAVVIRTLTSLGPHGQPVRLQPGPDPGAQFDRTLAITLARGIREVCVEADLQNRNRDDPLDPTPSDNRICRVLRVADREPARDRKERHDETE